MGHPFDNKRQCKRDSELVVSRHVGRGAQCSSTVPFNCFDCVCVLKGVPAGWQASINTCLTHAEFIRMYTHLSNDKNWTSADEVIFEHFKMYTGGTCNPRNISNVFADSALYSIQSLRFFLAKYNTAKCICEGIRSQRLSKYAHLNPDWCTQHGIELRKSTWHSVSCGCSKSETIVGDNKSISCCSIYNHINRDRHPELFGVVSPVAVQAISTGPHDTVVKHIRTQVRAIATRGGPRDCPRLLGHAAMLRQRNIYLLNIGKRK